MLKLLIAAALVSGAAAASAADMNAAHVICEKHRLSSHPLRLSIGSAFEAGFEKCDAVEAQIAKDRQNSQAAKDAADAADKDALGKALGQ